MKIIRLGLGEIISNYGTSHGKPALIIEPAVKPGLVGYKAPGSKDDPLHEDAIVLEIHDSSGVQILCEDLAEALKRAGMPIPFRMIDGATRVD